MMLIDGQTVIQRAIRLIKPEPEAGQTTKPGCNAVGLIGKFAYKLGFQEFPIPG